MYIGSRKMGSEGLFSCQLDTARQVMENEMLTVTSPIMPYPSHNSFKSPPKASYTASVCSWDLGTASSLDPSRLLARAAHLVKHDQHCIQGEDGKLTLDNYSPQHRPEDTVLGSQQYMAQFHI